MKNTNLILTALAFVFLSQSKLNAQWIELGGINGFATTHVGGGEIKTVAVGPQTNNVFVGGDFGTNTTREVSRYGASTNNWNQAGSFSANNVIKSISVTPYGTIAGGLFNNSNGQHYIAQYTGTNWTPFGTLPINGPITNITMDKLGKVYAGIGGNYTAVIKLGDTNWFELGGANSITSLLSASSQQLFSICTDQNNNVYACGNLSGNNGQRGVIKYNGSSWSFLPTITGILDALCSDKFGNIYVAVVDYGVVGPPRCYVAKFNGTTWSELGGNNSLNANSAINTLYCDGNGTIYAAGDFTNQSGKRYVAKFDGTTWSELGGANSLSANDQINVITSDTLDNILVAGRFKNSSGNIYIAKYICQIVKPIITANPGTTICEGGSVTLTSSAVTNNVWSTQETTRSISVNTAGTYSVTLNSGGCSSTSDPINIIVVPKPQVLLSEIPNCGFVNFKEPYINLIGSPIGGVFSGPGVGGDRFYPNLSGLGSAIVKYKFTDNNGCFNEVSKNIIVYDTLTINDTLTIRLNLGNGINNITHTTIKIYPNPTNSFLMIDYGSISQLNNYSVVIQNTIGQKIYEAKITSEKVTIDISKWGGKGLYYLNILNENGNIIQTRKIILY